MIKKRIWTSQPQVTVEIDWSNPITKGLVFCAVPSGITAYDLVTKTFGTVQGNISAKFFGRNGGFSSNSDGVAVAGSDTSNYILWPISTTRGAEMVNAATVLVLGGTTAQVTGKAYAFAGNSDAVISAHGYGLWIDALSVYGQGYLMKGGLTNSEGSPSSLLGTSFVNKTHFFGYTTADNGVSGNWFAQGSATPFSGKSAHGTTVTNRRAAVLSSGAYSGPYQKDCYSLLTLFWSRSLSTEEYRSLYANPWQIFRAPDDRIWLPISSGGGTTYTINPTGSIAYTSNTSYTKTKVTTPTGTVNLSGTASLVFTNGSTIYTITPTGNVTFNNNAVYIKTKVVSTSGLISYTGTSKLSRIRMILPNGNITYSGSAVRVRVTSLTVNGSIVYSGSAQLYMPGYGPHPTTKLPLTGTGI